METKRTFIFGIRKTQLKFLGQIVRKDGWENLTHTGNTEGKRDKVRQGQPTRSTKEKG